MTIKRLRGGRLASIVSGLVLGASALFNPLSSKGDDGVRLINNGDGINVTGSALDLGHIVGSQETNDVNDITWAEFEIQFPNGNNKWLKTHTEPYGIQLQTDVRPPESETTFECKLSPVDQTGGGVTSTNRLQFIIGTDNPNCDYAAKYTQTNYLPSGTNWITTFDIRDVINLDGGYVNLPGIVSVPSGTVYGTCNVGCGFYLDKIFLTNKANNAGSSGMRLIHLGGPEANDGDDFHDSTRRPILTSNLWAGAYTSPFGTNLFKDVRSRDGTNSYSFAGKLFAVNNTGTTNVSFSNDLEAIVNYVTESNRNYRLDLSITNGSYRVDGQPFSTNQVLTTNGVNIIPIGIVTNLPTGTNDYGDFALKQIFQVISSNGNNGSISPAGTNLVAVGDSFSITANPNYHVYLVQTNGGIAVSNDNNNLTSTNLSWQANSTGTIYAAFDINKYIISPSTPVNGTITPSSSVSVDHGNETNFNVDADSNYHIFTILQNGSCIYSNSANHGIASSNVVFGNVTNDGTISATFARDLETLVSSSTSGGTNNPNGTIFVPRGSNTNIIMQANANYHIKEVVQNGTTNTIPSGVTSTNWALNNVTASNNINTVYDIDIKNILSSAGANGSIVPAGTIYVPFGSSTSFVATANSHYHVFTILKNGTCIYSNSANTGIITTNVAFNSVDADGSIQAAFASDKCNLTVNSQLDGSSTTTTHDYGTTVNKSVTSPIDLGNSLRAVATGFYVTGNNYNSGSSTNANLTITNLDVIVDFLCKTQALLIVSSPQNGTIIGAATGYQDLQTLLSLTANPDSGYKLKWWTGDVPWASRTNNPLSVIIDQARSISALFDVLSPTTTYYNIVVLPTTNGTIRPSGTNTVSAGGSLEFLIVGSTVGNKRYELNNAYTNGIAIPGLTGGRTNSWTWSNINGNGTFSADFKRMIVPAQIGVYYPQGGLWFFRTPENADGYTSYELGGLGFEPVPGDYDGDGTIDPAVYNKSTGEWQAIMSQNGFVSGIFGGNDWIPVSGDYDGDEISDPTLYKRLIGVWQMLCSSLGYSSTPPGYGGPDLEAIAGDYDGDKKSDLGVYHRTTWNWYILPSGNGQLMQQQFGLDGAKLVPKDYDGDGKTDLAVYDPASGVWSISQSKNGFVQYQFGADGTEPIWNIAQ